MQNDGDWSKDRVTAILNTSKEMVRQALVGLYRRQNTDGRSCVPRSEHDGSGFNRHDAMELARLAQKVLKGEQLGASEMISARHRLPKYWRQIAGLMHPEVEKAMSEQEQRDQIAGSW